MTKKITTYEAKKAEVASTDAKSKQSTALTIIPRAEPTAEEKTKQLEEENAKLRAELSRIPQDLDKRIEYYKEKQEKINKLKNYETNKELLKVYTDELDEAADISELECDNFLLTVNKKAYPERTVLKMNNPILIGEVIKFIIDKIETKIETLKTEIAM